MMLLLLEKLQITVDKKKDMKKYTILLLLTTHVLFFLQQLQHNTNNLNRVNNTLLSFVVNKSATHNYKTPHTSPAALSLNFVKVLRKHELRW